MKLIIAGSRNLLVDSDFVEQAVRFFRIKVTEVMCGGGGNVDEAGEDWSNIYLGKEPKYFKAKWAEEGVAAGPIRNSKMAEYGDALLLIWDGSSKGSLSMKKEMAKRKKTIYEMVLRTI